MKKINLGDINTEPWDLSVKNPNKKDESVLREPNEILEGIKDLDKESEEIIKKIKELI